jgi:hypothetical protein
LLLVLLGVGTAVAPSTGDGYAVQHRAPVIGESVSAAPSMNDDLHDWLRLSMAARQAPAVDVSDTWWALRKRTTDGYDGPGRRVIGAVGDTGMAAAEPTARSSRAPPYAWTG